MWKSIQTAPKDGTRFLAWCECQTDEYDDNNNIIRRNVIERYAVVAYFAFGTFVEFPWRGSFPVNLKFTHWHHIPSPPNSQS